jgi:hypothetical protein
MRGLKVIFRIEDLWGCSALCAMQNCIFWIECCRTCTAYCVKWNLEMKLHRLSQPSESALTQQSMAESPVRRSQPSESAVRVSRPSQLSESAVRVSCPSQPSESAIRVSCPSQPSESAVRVTVRLGPSQIFFGFFFCKRGLKVIFLIEDGCGCNALRCCCEAPTAP